MRRQYLIIAVILFITVVAIVEAQTSRRMRRVPMTDAEAAQQQVWKEFNTRASACNGSYFTRRTTYSGGYEDLEMKGCSAVVRVVKPNTEADRLNGILWSGALEIQCSAWRVYPSGRWNDWDYFLMSHGFMFSYDVWKAQDGFHSQILWDVFRKSPVCTPPVGTIDIDPSLIAPTSKVTPDNSYAFGWTVELKKSDGWFDTGIRVKSGQMLNVTPDDFEVPLLKQKVDLRLSNSGLRLIPPKNPKSPYSLGIHIYYMNNFEVGKYKRCLENQTWITVRPGWSDTLRLKIDDQNPVDSIKLNVVLFPASFRNDMPCMAGQ